MSVGMILNIMAWIGCAVFSWLILTDLYKVETGKYKSEEEKGDQDGK